MKKYLMTGIAALAISAGFTSCSKDDFEPMTQAQIDKAKYDQVFREYIGGSIARGQNWGFGSVNVSRAFTRAITVNNDVYDKFPSAEEVAQYFPTAIPGDAVTDAELEEKWKGEVAPSGVQMWDLYAIYKELVGTDIKNIKVTEPGEFSVGHSWANPADKVYNVYIAIGDGKELTLKRNGAEHVNFYIMSGEVTIDSDFGECGGIISVAAGATVKDERTHIAHNDGIKVFNRGTYTATNTATYWNGSANVATFDIGNHCTFYNEGSFSALGGLSYSPGDANTSYFMNLGDDAKVTAPSMTLNSTGTFYNSGTVNISGETNVTQRDIYWVNAGHYTTGSMVFSAKNATFFNYCQLIVTGNAHMFDGEFNLMDNSYTEAGTAEMDNFIVNMGSNTGMHIKGDVRMIAQADGTYQGFRTSGSNDYLLIDGKVTVDSHYHTFSVSEGITYSVKQIEIIKDGQVVTDEYLKSISDGDYPVLDLNGTACPYGKLTVTANTNGCGATWSQDGEPTVDPTPSDPSEPVVDPDDPQEEVTVGDLRIMGEDLSANEAGDFDFNDIVIDVKFDATNAIVILRAAGGTLPLRISGNDQWEVHSLFGVDQKVMVNTAPGRHNEYAPVEIKLPYGISSSAEAKNIKLEVLKNGEWQELTAEISEPAAKLAVGLDCEWLDERTSIKDVYQGFVEWATQNHNKSQWWK